MKTKNNLFSNFYTILSSLLFGLLVVTQSQGQNISFDQSALDFKNFPTVNQGTSLKFGPDGRLYAAQLNGIIKVLTINQTGLNKYEVIGEEVLDGVKQIPNHEDNGKAAFDNRNNRQITGITVEGTATNPVIYASSSDPKWGGPSGDKVLDTNSGVITRLTWTGTEWEVIDLVRGLPRSEENHSTNGLEFTMINGKPYLLVTSGGFTNAGAPSKNFAYISEYALSAAILSIDLDAIEAMPTENDPVSGRMFKYDIPTLDDPSRPNKNFVYDPNHPSYDGIDINDPFGGNDGLNMGMLVEGGPVQIFSAGYRNSYDLVVTENNGLYVTDNGANTNWGGLPEHEGNAEMVSNRYLPDEPGGSSLTPSASGEYVDNQDQLILITSDLNTYTFGSFYGGHPTPVRANPGQPYQPGAIFPFNPGGAGLYTKFIGDDSNWSNITPDFSPTDHFRTQILQPIAPGTEGFEEYASNSLPVNWPPVPLSLANGAEADFIAPTLYNPNGPQPSVVAILPINSNGIDEYKASNFGGAIKGSLIAGKSGGTLHLVNLNPDGSLKSMETNKWNLNGGNALGISCNGDSDIFPGTIWAATFDGRIMVLTPTDNLSCLSPEDPNFDPSADYDFDGYSNQDELDNGTDYCSGASIPNDYDNDLISDKNDLDDDGDGILDENDPFQLGYPMNLPVDNQLFTIQQDNLGRESGYLGLGLTGLMNNGAPNPNWLDWLDKPEERPGPADIYGGAAGAIQVSMTGGTANGTSNNQEKGFQFGVNVGLESGKFTISSGLLGLSAPGSLYDFDGLGEVGIQIGDGTQSNFIKLVFTETHLVAAQEIEDVPDASPIMYAIPIENRPLSDELVEIGFDVEPLDGSVIPFYKFGNADKVSIGMIQTTGLIKEAIQNSTVPLAIGIFGTSNDWAKDFIAVWDYFEVVSEKPYIRKILSDQEKIVNDPDKIIDLNQHFDDNKGAENLTYQILHNSNPVFDAVITDNFLTLGFPNEVSSSELTIRATDQDGFYVDQSFTVSTKLDEQVILRINAGGGILADESTNTDWKSNNIAGATSNEFFSVNTGKISNNTFDPINRHSSIPSYISDQLYAQIFSTERYSGLQLMQYQIPIENGDYLVKLYMGNGYDGTSQPGQRVFDILVEGQTVISQLDLAVKFGHKVGGMEQIPVSVTDGELNIDFQKSIENPLINGIEIIRLFGLIEHTPILFTPLENRINLPGDELDGSLFIEASGGDGNLSFSAQGLPPGIVIEPTNGTLYGTIAEDAYANSPYLVTITLDDEDGTDSDALSFDFTWTVSPPLTLQTWQVKNESQDYTGRHENSFVQAGDKFYLLGGREEPKKVDVYDYQTDTWQALQNSSPFDFNHFQAVEYEGLIWVIGAFKDNNFPVESPTDHIWAFDPVRQEWIQGPEIPQDRKRGSAGVVLYNNKFYIVNGNKKGHDGEYVNLFDEYDPLTGTWTVLENSPRARDHFFSTVVANKMYVVSGRQSGGDGGVFGPVIPEVDVYNFTTHTWSTLPVNQNIPTPRAAATVNNYLNKIIVAGGEVPDNSTALAITEMYDPQKEEWVSLKPLNFPRYGTQGIVSGKGLYVLGGSPTRGGGNQKNMEVFGFDEPKGSPLLASEITTVDTLFLKSGISENLTLNVENGNTGIFIRSIKIVGINTTDFVIHSGVLTNSLLRANSQHELSISYNGIEELIEADLVIDFGKSGTKIIPIKAGTIDHYNPITVANPIPDQSAQVNLAFNFTFAENTFYHSEAGGLNYTASLSDGNALPTWLEFDGTSRTFSGIPPISSIGTISIRVTATDGTYNRSDEFVLTVEGENFTGLSGINSGGPQFTSGAGFVYDADNSFVGGSTYTNNNIADISGTTDDTMYRSERHGGGGSFSYNVAVPAGTYLVRLHFAEIWIGATGGGTGGIGSRVFNVLGESQPLLTNFDIIAEVGTMAALVKEFEVSVTDGTLNLLFQKITENPKVSAIEIVEKPKVLSSDPETLQFMTQATGTLSEPQILTLTNPEPSSIEVNSVVITGENSNEFTHDFTSPFILESGASANLAIVFAPASEGAKSAQVEVGHTGSGSPLIIGLNGEGFVPIDPGTPVVVNPIPDQFATEGIAFTFTFSQTTFSDPNGDPLLYSASLSDGTPLPSWLGFDALTRTFSGVPSITDIGTMEIMVTASDGILSVSDRFTLAVEGQVTTSIGINSGGLQFTSGSGFVYDADNSFVGGSTYTNNNIADITGTTDDAMYRSERHGGGGSFSYNVAVPAGTYLVRLHFAEIWIGATGGGTGGIGSRVFNVLGESQPLLTNFDIIAEVGTMAALVKEVEVSVTDGTLNLLFQKITENPKVSAIEIVEKPKVVLSYPETLNFTAQTTGTLSEPQAITLTNGEPTSIEVNSVVITGVNSNEFTHDFTGPLILESGASANLSLTFAPVSQGLKSAQVEVGHTGSGALLITGLNGEAIAAIDPGTPVVVSPIPDQAATEGIAFTFTFSQTTFSDPNGDPLLYSASLSDGTPLPSWLGFDALTRTFSGVPSITDIGTMEIMVTASDGILSVSDRFTLAVDEQVTTSIGINSGGPQFTSGAGFVYDADNSFVGGSTYTNNNIADISGTTDDAMYRSERHGGGGSFSYNVALPAGTYLVRLHFAEIWIGATGGGTGGIGSRVFNVLGEGQPLLTNFDIVAEVGSMAALVKEFEISVTDGTLNLFFQKVTENPKVSAIEILSLAMPTGTNQRMQTIDNSKPAGLPINGESLVTNPHSISREEILISAYPNPFESIIYLRMPGEDPQEYLVRVYDVSGKEYYRKVFRTELTRSSIFEIDLSNLMLASGGVYLLVVESDKGEFIRTIKMIKR